MQPLTEHHRARWNTRYRDRPDRFGSAPAPLLTELLRALAPGRVVEFGCGEGRNCRYLVGQGWEVLGLDFSEVAIERATMLVSAGTFVCADITRPGLIEPGSFDLACAIYLHTSPAERWAWLSELVRAVRPGGHVIYVGHAPGDPPEPERPGVALLTAAGLRELSVVRDTHNHNTEPGHRAKNDFGILWRRD